MSKENKKVSDLFAQALRPEDLEGARWDNPRWLTHQAIQEAQSPAPAWPPEIQAMFDTNKIIDAAKQDKPSDPST